MTIIRTVGAFFLLLLAGPSLYAAKTLDIYFIDTEVGNAVMLVTPSGQAMMFDTGQAREDVLARIMTVIQKAGVKQLDYVVVSHYHWDHYGTVAKLSEKIPILNYVDHGPNVDLARDPEHYVKYGGTGVDPQFDEYAKTREKGKYIVAQPGDRIPMKDIDVRILTSAGNHILKPLPGAGRPNPVCASMDVRVDDESEDGQSVSKLVTFGKFRYADFGDLTWNKSFQLFCPDNMIGTVDLYLISHHGDRHEPKDNSVWNWGRSSAPPAEVWALHPRVAILSAGEDYIGRTSNDGTAWQTTHRSPGIEDIWQLHYQTQGAKLSNSADQFIANPHTVNDQGHYIKVSAEMDGSFTVTNSRNGFTKRYAARGGAEAPAVKGQ